MPRCKCNKFLKKYMTQLFSKRKQRKNMFLCRKQSPDNKPVIEKSEMN